MKLSFENVGKVAKAEIEVDSITIIAGANDTGKSTAGKILYAIYTALCDLTPKKLLLDKIKSLIEDEEGILSLVGESLVVKDGKSHRIAHLYEPFREAIGGANNFNYKLGEENLNKFVIRWVIELQKKLKIERLPEQTKKQINHLCEKILVKANTASGSQKMQLFSIQDILLAEFSGSLTTELLANRPAKIHLHEDNGNIMNFVFLANEINYTLSNVKRKREYEQPFYIENPFVLDELNNPRRNMSDGSYKHNERMINAIENLQVQSHLDATRESNVIRSILDSVIEGRIFKKGLRYQYQTSEMLNPVDVESLSAGMKSFAILKMLFDSQRPDEIEILILDEPEIHLHPEWQLKYAELVVLLASKHSVQIVITTHSPYFIEAIELYSKKHGIGNHVRYYSAIKHENGMAEIIDATKKLEILYESMVEPFQNLEELRDELDGA